MKKDLTELFNYLNIVIKSAYELNDKAHDEKHLNSVITNTNCLLFCYNNNVPEKDMISKREKNLILIAAIYHDCRLFLGRQEHEIRASNEVLNDQVLKEYLSDDEIKKISIMVKEHRTSAEKTLIGSKILCEADKLDGLLDVQRMIYRCIHTTIQNDYNLLENKDIFEEVYNHLNKKYGKDGTFKLQLPFSIKQFEKQKIEVENILNNKEQFRNECNTVKNDILTIDGRKYRLKNICLMELYKQN